MPTAPKPCIERRVKFWHWKNMTDGEIAKQIGVSVQRVSAARKRLGLNPHMLTKYGKRMLNVEPQNVEAGRWKAKSLPEDEISRLYAGQRYDAA